MDWMWLLIVTCVFLSLLLVLLFTPLRIYVDSYAGTAQAAWGPVQASVEARQDDLIYRIRLPFYSITGSVFDVNKRRGGEPKAAKRRVRSSSTRRRKAFMNRRRAWSLLSSFKVRRFRWYLDTGDVLWNAWLFPLFHLWRIRGYDVGVVFHGRSGLTIALENNFYRLIKAAFINSSNQHP